MSGDKLFCWEISLRYYKKKKYFQDSEANVKSTVEEPNPNLIVATKQEDIPVQILCVLAVFFGRIGGLRYLYRCTHLFLLGYCSLFDYTDIGRRR